MTSDVVFLREVDSTQVDNDRLMVGLRRSGLRGDVGGRFLICVRKQQMRAVRTRVKAASVSARRRQRRANGRKEK